MIGWLKDLWANGLIRALALTYLRNGLKVGGMAALAWLQTKGFPHDQSAQIVGDLAGAALVAIPMVLDHMDVNKVDKQVKTVAVIAADNAVNPSQEKADALARLVGGTA